MMIVLQCRRNEQSQPYDTNVAVQLAQQLYDAGAARTLSCDPEPFIRILGNTNSIQFDSINAQYRNQALLKDINSKLGGRYKNEVITAYMRLVKLIIIFCFIIMFFFF
jgi:hypothetical protein